MTLVEKILEDNYIEDYENPITEYQAEKIVRIADDYAIEFGEKLEFVKQVVFKKQANKEIFLVEFTDSETRESYTYLRSSADLDQGEFNTSIERFRNLSAERGLYIPTGEEYLTHRFQIDREIERNKLYL